MILAVNTFPSLFSLLYHTNNHFRKYVYFFTFGLVAQILAWCCAHSRDSRNIFFWETIKIISKHTYSFCWNFQHPSPYGFTWNRVFPCSTVVRNLPANAGDTGDVGLIPGLGRSPGGWHATCCSTLVWRIPRTEELGQLQSIGSQRVGHDWSDLVQHMNPLYPLLLSFYHKQVLNFIKGFSASIEIVMIFILQFVNVMYHIDVEFCSHKIQGPRWM